MSIPEKNWGIESKISILSNSTLTLRTQLNTVGWSRNWVFTRHKNNKNPYLLSTRRKGPTWFLVCACGWCLDSGRDALGWCLNGDWRAYILVAQIFEPKKNLNTKKLFGPKIFPDQIFLVLFFGFAPKSFLDHSFFSDQKRDVMRNFWRDIIYKLGPWLAQAVRQNSSHTAWANQGPSS